MSDTTIKTITLHQPWASLVATGHKQCETRSWSTKHRGPLVIHAAKTTEHLNLCYTEPFYAWLNDVGLTISDLPLGKVVAVCNLQNTVECTRDNMANMTWPEGVFGDFSPGRYAWLLTDVLALNDQEEVRGRQRLWNWNYAATSFGNIGAFMATWVAWMERKQDE